MGRSILTERMTRVARLALWAVARDAELILPARTVTARLSNAGPLFARLRQPAYRSHVGSCRSARPTALPTLELLRASCT
jgi:hypothetical protein